MRGIGSCLRPHIQLYISLGCVFSYPDTTLAWFYFPLLLHITAFKKELHKMTLISYLTSPYVILAIPILYYILPYIRNWSIRDIPAPFPAAFTNLWLMYVFLPKSARVEV